MVWGMIFPSGFGDFWPVGKNEGEGRGRASQGWHSRLREHYASASSSERNRLYGRDDATGEWEYPFYAVAKFTHEMGSRPDPEKPRLTAIEPHEPLHFFQTDKAERNLGSLIALNSGLLAADETMKGIIEALEPGVHQFYPVEIRMRRGQVYPVPYYVLVVGRYLDSFSKKDSNEACYTDKGPGYIFYEESKKSLSGLAFRKSEFGAAHFWREKSLKPIELICISEELMDEIKKAGLRIPKHYQMQEV